MYRKIILQTFKDFDVYLTLATDFESGLFCLLNLDTLILITDFYVSYWAHGGCDRSAGDAYSSMAHDPTSDIFKGPCTPILFFVSPIGLMRLNTAHYCCHFIYLYFVFAENPALKFVFLNTFVRARESNT
jgi:hypothetical protein